LPDNTEKAFQYRLTVLLGAASQDSNLPSRFNAVAEGEGLERVVIIERENGEQVARVKV
jgi:hypothetical protein